MREAWRHIVAVLFVLSGCMIFLPLIEVSGISVSLMDVMKMGSGIGETEWGELGEIAKNYMKPFFFLILVLIILILASAVLAEVAGWRRFYIPAFLGALVINVMVVICGVSVYQKMKALRSGLDFFGMGDAIQMKSLPIILWSLVYAGIFALCAMGFVKGRQIPQTGAYDILPEGFHQKKNPWVAPIKHPEVAPIKHPKVTEQDYLNQIRSLEKEKKEKQEQQKQQAWEQDLLSSYQGALRGKSGIFTGKVFLMEERVPVYFVWDGQQVSVAGQQSEEVLAEVFYLPVYGEYCVTPRERLCCFLESGQPLGRERHYYLSRGTVLYLKDPRMKFELA